MMNTAESIGALSNIPKDMPQQSMPPQGVQQVGFNSLNELLMALPDDFTLDSENIERAIREIGGDKGQQGILIYELDELTKNLTEGM